MSRTLTFQQITDSRDTEIEKCLPELETRIQKLEKLLNIEGVEVEIGNPYLLDWTESMGKYYKELAEKTTIPEQKERLLKLANTKQIQYRANFRIKKNTRQITWNDIYKIVNSVKAVPYSFE